MGVTRLMNTYVVTADVNDLIEDSTVGNRFPLREAGAGRYVIIPLASVKGCTFTVSDGAAVVVQNEPIPCGDIQSNGDPILRLNEALRWEVVVETGTHLQMSVDVASANSPRVLVVVEKVAN